jgi:hypothetical protein
MPNSLELAPTNLQHKWRAVRAREMTLWRVCVWLLSVAVGGTAGWIWLYIALFAPMTHAWTASEFAMVRLSVGWAVATSLMF